MLTQKQRIEAWLEDLESGKYKQGRGQLQEGNSYCCLGVACKTYQRLTKSKKKLHFNNSGRLMGSNLSEQQVVFDYFGFNQEEGELVLNDGSEAYLAEMNDNGRSFKQIAKTIRSQLNKLDKGKSTLFVNKG